MTDTTTLRVAQRADAIAIRALTRDAYAKWVEVIGCEPLPMQVNYREALTKHRFDLLYVGDRLAGVLETVPQRRCLRIESVAVLPVLQRRGYGTRLLKLAEELAWHLNLEGVRLYTNKLFVDNVSFYEALGYSIEKEEQLNGGTAVYMTKSISHP